MLMSIILFATSIDFNTRCLAPDLELVRGVNEPSERGVKQSFVRGVTGSAFRDEKESSLPVMNFASFRHVKEFKVRGVKEWF
mmetsp:Transcript_7238/g.12369  ORF Transcript_7238/g.12369 Transcript_7238/m.12369 type:complete len:82 (-) Transcript_7238:238-483(-)